VFRTGLTGDELYLSFSFHKSCDSDETLNLEFEESTVELSVAQFSVPAFNLG